MMQVVLNGVQPSGASGATGASGGARERAGGGKPK